MSGHYSIRVNAKGPIADGLAGAALERWADAVGEELANMAQAEIQRRALLFSRSRRGRHPSHPFRVQTGEAARHVKVSRTPTSAWKVTGESFEGVVWWPWLEGTSKRNVGNRFRGYHTFRTVKNIVQRKARRTGEDLLQARYLELMGGK